MIIRERKREEGRERMRERVKDTKTAMDRIAWEEKQCTGRRYTAMTGITDASNTKNKKTSQDGFIRCSISNVVEHLRNEEEEKAERLEEKRKNAALRRMKAEQDDMRRKNDEKERKHQLKDRWKVDSIDSLGMTNAGGKGGKGMAKGPHGGSSSHAAKHEHDSVQACIDDMAFQIAQSSIHERVGHSDDGSMMETPQSSMETSTDAEQGCVYFEYIRAAVNKCRQQQEKQT